MQVGVKIERPQPVLRRADGPLQEATTHQLMLELDAMGWQNHVLGKNAAKQAKKTPFVVHDPSARKCWVTRAGQCNVYHHYLLALLTAGDHG